MHHCHAVKYIFTNFFSNDAGVFYEAVQHLFMVFAATLSTTIITCQLNDFKWVLCLP